jgi:hypothetical protein
MEELCLFAATVHTGNLAGISPNNQKMAFVKTCRLNDNYVLEISPGGG